MNLEEVNLSGEGMCLKCINGEHSLPSTQPVTSIAHGSKTGKLCNCPCHLPKSSLKAKKKHRAPAAEQTVIAAPTMRV